MSNSQSKLSRTIARLERLPAQMLARSPFDGDIKPSRVPIFWASSGRPSLPFPHPWNYTQPIQILDTFFWGADSEEGSGRHNRYLDYPGFAPVLVTRDPGVIRAITTETGDGPGQFDRDTLHFGFGHGPRVCPGKHLGQLEVGLAIGTFVKMFRFSAPNPELIAKAGVSTKPADGVVVELELRKG